MYLNCKTYYSFKYGTYSTEELVKTAANEGISTLAITNINNTCDAWDFVKHCQEENIKPILGVEIRQIDGLPENTKPSNQLLYILLAANNNGFSWINEFLSDHLINKKPFPAAGTTPFFRNLADGFVIYPIGSKEPGQLLPNERIGVAYWELNKLYATNWKKHPNQFVIRHPVTIQDKKHHALHRLLRSIDKNTLLSKLPKEEEASIHEVFISPTELLDKFSQYPFLVTNTYKLMEGCGIHMDFKTDKTKRTYGGSAEDDRILLEKLATDGLVARYGKKNKKANERLQKELKIINDLGFNSYFLINLDIIRYAQSRGFYYVGRGSGANSIVAYCLRITDVDPIELNLFFERFLNPHRTSPPDLISIFPGPTATRSLIIFLNDTARNTCRFSGLIQRSRVIRSSASWGKFSDYPMKRSKHCS
jgi:DNA polymerase III alpha subunit